jgi:hypothetical protein
MAGRKVFNEADALRCLTAVKASRVDLGTWARAHGVDGRSLNLWRANLARRGKARVRPAALRLVEVVAASQRSTSTPFVVRVGGVELVVSPCFDEAALRRLVGVLKSC